jgi:hypothetical protein
LCPGSLENTPQYRSKYGYFRSPKKAAGAIAGLPGFRKPDIAQSISARPLTSGPRRSLTEAALRFHVKMVSGPLTLRL